MTNFAVRNVPQYTYAVCSFTGQTIFAVSFGFEDPTSLQVFKRSANASPIDATDLLTYNTDYTVTGAGASSGGTVVLNAGATIGDIINIWGNQPYDRIDSLPNINQVSVQIDGDLNTLTILTNQLNTQLNVRVPQYPASAVVPTNATILPLLPQGFVWVGGSANTIVTGEFSNLAPGDATYIIQTADADLPNAQILANLSNGLIKNATGSGVLSIAIPGTDYVVPADLGTMAYQNANSVAITGGAISGVTLSLLSPLALSSGGTAATTAAGARTNLGLGTLAVQNANNVNITGGSITGVSGVVSRVNSGTGLTGGPITATGTLSIANTSVSAGTYVYPTTVTVNAQGQLTAISAGLAPANGNSLEETITQASHGFTVGQVLYFNGTQYALANAAMAATAEVIGIVQSVVDSSHFVLLVSGFIATLSGLTAGDTYFLSDSVAGALTTTEPTAAGHISKPLLNAVSSTTGNFVNMRGKVIPGPIVQFQWATLTTDATLQSNFGYFLNSGSPLSLALPSTFSVGDVIELISLNNTQYTITQSSGQQIIGNAVETTIGASGTVSSLVGSINCFSLKLVGQTANTTFVVPNVSIQANFQ